MDFSYYISQDKFTETEKQILRYLEQNDEHLREKNIQKVAEENYTSTSTIFRLAKKLGFGGYTDMVYYITANLSSDLSNGKVADYLSALNTQISDTFYSNEDVLTEIQEQFRPSNNIFILGSGYSGIIGEYLYKKLFSKGLNVFFSNGSDSNALFLNNVQRMDVLVCVSKSGETETINRKAQLALDNDIYVISFTQDAESTLALLSNSTFLIKDGNFLDKNNLQLSEFYPLLLMYLEYMMERFSNDT